MYLTGNVGRGELRRVVTLIHSGRYESRGVVLGKILEKYLGDVGWKLGSFRLLKP
jgi:hypothetical protein